jgi:hypothetical protein
VAACDLIAASRRGLIRFVGDETEGSCNVVRVGKEGTGGYATFEDMETADRSVYAERSSRWVAVSELSSAITTDSF